MAVLGNGGVSSLIKRVQVKLPWNSNQTVEDMQRYVYLGSIISLVTKGDNATMIEASYGVPYSLFFSTLNAYSYNRAEWLIEGLSKPD